MLNGIGAADFTLPVLIALASLLLASISAAFSWYGLLTSRRALKISAKASHLAEGNTSAFLIDAFRYRVSISKLSLYVFTVSIVSKSTAPNSLISVEFRMPVIKDNVERTIVVGHSSNATSSTGLDLKNLGQVPAILPPRGAIISSFCFEIPDNLVTDAQFGPYNVHISYAEGQATEVRTNVIMDVIDAEHLERKRKSGVPI